MSIKSFLGRFFIFGSIYRPIIPFKVNLLYWKPSIRNDNVGDLLSKVIYHKLLAHYNLEKRIIFPKTIRLAMIGSIMSFLSEGKTTVYGSGMMNSDSISALNAKRRRMHLDIRAVRGPKSREILLRNGYACPELYGDPAILLPLFYKPKVKTIKGKVVIIPHHSRFEVYNTRYSNVINTYTSDWKKFIEEILSAEKVISSSLHGIIVSESYGIPTVMLNDIPDDIFKYDDYYESTDRFSKPIGSTVEECMNIPGDINLKIEYMQRLLIKAFPTDLFLNNIFYKQIL